MDKGGEWRFICIFVKAVQKNGDVKKQKRYEKDFFDHGRRVVADGWRFGAKLAGKQLGCASRF